MKGFDYRTQQALDLPSKQWRLEMEGALAEGGKRRVRDGETFVKDAQGTILFEVYGNLS